MYNWKKPKMGKYRLYKLLFFIHFSTYDHNFSLVLHVFGFKIRREHILQFTIRREHIQIPLLSHVHPDLYQFS